MSNVIVSGKIKIAETSRDKALGLIGPLVEATRQEAGCISYGFYEDLTTQGAFQLHEIWESQEALDAHMQTPHIATFNASIGEIEVLDLSIDFYDATKRA